MLSRTSLAFLDFSTITSLSFTAVCILRTLDWFLGRQHVWAGAGHRDRRGSAGGTRQGWGWAAAQQTSLASCHKQPPMGTRSCLCTWGPRMPPHPHPLAPKATYLQVLPLPASITAGLEKKRERRGECWACTRCSSAPNPHSAQGPPHLPPSPLHRWVCRDPAAGSCSEQGGAHGPLPGHGDTAAAHGAVRLHVEEVLDALGADRALALVLLGHGLLLGPGEMHLLRGRLRLFSWGLGAAGEGGGVFVVDELDLRQSRGVVGRGWQKLGTPSPPSPAGHGTRCLTSSSGFSSPSPTCSSGTLRRRRVLAGFLRRMEPRDSSVMLWICTGWGQRTAGQDGGTQRGRVWGCASPPARARSW